MEGSERLKIPEPLIVDLVRPLGSKVGELEINSLFRVDMRTGDVKWAPEIEAVVFPWLALEFELPLENATLESYKFAAQGGLYAPRNTTNYDHGWQVIYQKGRHNLPDYFAALYLSGYRWSRTISSMSLNGWDTEWTGNRQWHSLKLNNTLFWQRPRWPTFGFESNLRWGSNGVEAALTPQIHLRLTSHLNFQIGAGAARPKGGPWTPSLAGRLIYDFH